MAIKFAEDIVKEIQERGSVKVPEGYVTGEDFEEWLYKEMICIENIDVRNNDMDINETNIAMLAFAGLDFFSENYGEAA